MKEIQCPACGKGRVVDKNWVERGGLLCPDCREDKKPDLRVLNVVAFTEAEQKEYREKKEELIRKEIENPLERFPKEWNDIRVLKPKYDYSFTTRY